jgi:hypothetical protein
VGPGFALVLYGVPTAIGWCRALITFVGPTSDPARLPPAPGMPKMVRFVLGLLSTVTPLFHANIQNAIIGAPASSRDPAAGLGHRVGARRPQGTGAGRRGGCVAAARPCPPPPPPQSAHRPGACARQVACLLQRPPVAWPISQTWLLCCLAAPPLPGACPDQAEASGFIM